MSLIVQKFGGTSVRDAKRIRNVAGIIAETYLAGNDVIVVLSAQGDTTDDLIAKAEEINPHASKREMDMLLSTGEQISVALCAMALEAMGLPSYPWLLGRWGYSLPPSTPTPGSRRSTPSVSSPSWTSTGS